MVKQGQGGSAVIVSSPHAQIAFPNAMAYNIAKAGLDQMMRSAARELLQPQNPRQRLLPRLDRHARGAELLHRGTDPEGAKGLPWGRLATSEEVARAIVFLLDPASDYITGVDPARRRRAVPAVLVEAGRGRVLSQAHG